MDDDDADIPPYDPALDDPDYYVEYDDGIYDYGEYDVATLILDDRVDLRFFGIDPDGPINFHEKEIDLFNEKELGSLTQRLKKVSETLAKLPSCNNATYGAVYPKKKRVRLCINHPCYGNSNYLRPSGKDPAFEIVFVRAPTGDTMGYSPGSSVQRVGGLEKWRNDPDVRAWMTWFLTGSPWATRLFNPMREIKLRSRKVRDEILSTDFLMNTGLIIYGIDPDTPTPLLTTALNAYRLTWEMPWLCRVWHKLVKGGADPNVANWCANVLFYSNKTSGDFYPQTIMYISGHGYLAGGDVDRLSLRGTFTGEFDENFLKGRKVYLQALCFNGNCTGAFGEQKIAYVDVEERQKHPFKPTYLPRFNYSPDKMYRTIWPDFVNFFGPYIRVVAHSYSYSAELIKELKADVDNMEILNELGETVNEFAKATIEP